MAHCWKNRPGQASVMGRPSHRKLGLLESVQLSHAITGRLTWPQYLACLPHKNRPVAAPIQIRRFLTLFSPRQKQKETASERSLSRQGHQALEGKAPKATGVVHGNNTRCSPHTAKRQRRVQDKTALEIAANEALFGQTGGGADEPWALGLPSTSSSGHSSNTGAPWGVEDAAATPAWYGNSNSSTPATAASGDFFTRSGNHNPRSGKTGGGNSRRAKGGGDSLPLAGADAPSMGNYDHLRMPVPHRIAGQTPQVSQVATATGTTLPHRMKAAPVSSGNSSSSGPYFHHFLERNNSSNSSTNSLLFNPGTNFLETQVPINTPGKRPRPSNSSSNNSGNMNFLSPIGFPSPPSFETDHPLPDFNTNWGFNSRNVAKTSSSTSSAPVLSSSALTTSSHSNVNATTTSSLSAIGSGLSSPNGASMFAGVDSFLPDYDSTLYNLWSAPSGGVMGYETENDAAQGQQQQVPPPLYMPPEDELKMDYPQLSEFKEFNQDLDSYLCGDTMESGGPSPTTPLGTTTATSMMKMDHLVTADRRATAGNGVGGSAVGGANLTAGNREPQLDRLLTPATTTATTEYTNREHGTMGLGNTSSRAAKRSRGAYEDSFGAAPASTGVMSGSSTSTTETSFRNAPMTTKVEPKRAMPSLGSYRSGQSFLMPTATATSQAAAPSSGVTMPKTIVTSTAAPAISDTSTTKTTKRPRSRQCVFPGCQNRARSHQKCKKHGGAHQCVFEGCTKNSQSRGLCIAHGGGSRCTKEGCVRAAQSKGLCKSHGGGESCAVEGCKKKAHLKHLCRTHGGGVRCKFDKCAKWAQRKGWCMAHAKEFEAT